MAVIDRAELLLQAANYSGSGNWLDESGNGHDAVPNGGITFLAHSGIQYLWLPGSSGNYASTPDTNLLDADTAHMHQSIGKWVAGTDTLAVDSSPPGTLAFGTKALKWTIGTAGQRWLNSNTGGLNGEPVSPSTQYSASVTVYKPSTNTGADLDVAFYFTWYDNTGAQISTTFSAYAAIASDTWITLTETATSPANAAYCRVIFTVQNAAVNDVFWASQAIIRTGSTATFVPSSRIVGDIDIRFSADLEDTGGNTVVLGRFAGNNAIRRWGIGRYDTTGKIALWMSDGTNVDWGVRSAFTLTGGRKTGRVTFDGTTTTVYSSNDDGETWTLVDTDTPTYSYQGTSYDGVFAPEVGAGGGGTYLPSKGKFYWVEVRDGIDGPLVFDAGFNDAGTVTQPFDSFTDPQGNSWTINRSSSGYVSWVVDRAQWVTDGSDDYLEVADAAGLNFAAADDLTVLAVIRPADATPAADQVIVAKKDDLTTAAGYALYNDTLGTANGLIADGTTSPEDASPSLSDRVLTPVAVVRNTTDDDIEAFAAGVGSGTPTTDSTTATLANALPLRIGATSGTAASFFRGEIIAVAIWREALSDADVATAGDELVNYARLARQSTLALVSEDSDARLARQSLQTLLTTTPDARLARLSAQVLRGNISGGHAGLSLSESDYNNVFVRRKVDGSILFRVNYGGTNYIEFDSRTGTLTVAGHMTLRGGVLTGDLNLTEDARIIGGTLTVKYGPTNVAGFINDSPLPFAAGNEREITTWSNDLGSEVLDLVLKTRRDSDGSDGATASVGLMRVVDDITETALWFEDTRLSSHNLGPRLDNTYGLGDASYRWTDVWAVDGTINTSDPTQKADLAASPLGLDFLRRLSGRQWRWKETGQQKIRGQRLHHGLDASEVHQALTDLGVDTADFAGLIIDSKGRYALRSHEFLAPVVNAINELDARLTAGGL